MADEEKEEGESPKSVAPKRSLDKTTLLILLNTVFLLIAIGFAVYTKLIFKRPPITEKDERTRLKELEKNPTISDSKKDGFFVTYEPMTLNIKSSPRKDQTVGKLQYLILGFSVELENQETQNLLKEINAQFLDKLIALLGNKELDKINNVQGRYILRSEMVEIINELAGSPIAMNIYFDKFILQ